MSGNFFGELKRRNVIKVTGGYILLGWLVLQIADVIVPALHLPVWTITMVLIIGLLGLPFVIFFAWVYEITPDGLKLTKEVDQSQSITKATGKKLEYGIIAGLSLALVIMLVKPTLVHDVTDHDEYQQQLAGEESSETEISDNGMPSIAVLPFEDFSPQKDQGYFSNGISEEILNLLAKTNRLRVAARTSSFAFRGDNTDIREIGEKLNVETVLEGSIRKAGNKVRITAQLIKASDGYHIWSETYDRDLKDVFAIQDEISRAILDSLKLHLLGESKPAQKTMIDLDAYDKFLIANERLQRNTSEDLESAITLFKEAIAIEPTYTDAKVKAILASLILETKQNSREDFLDREEITDNLFNTYLKPLTTELENNYELHGVIGRYHQRRFRFDVAEEHLKTALQLNQNYADAYLWLADIHYEKADYQTMLKERETAYRLNPMSLEISRELAYDYRSFWRPDDAKRIIDRMFVLYPGHEDAYDARVANLAAHGHYAEATLVLEEALQIHPDSERFKNWLVWGYIYLNKQEKLNNFDLDWQDYENTLTYSGPESALPLLEEHLKSAKHDEWLSSATGLYMLLGQKDNLKSILVQRIENMDKRNVPWRKRCYTYMIAAMQMTDMTDNIQTMMDRCRETTEKRLKAGYFCPCTYFRLVEFAIVDNRYEDAVKRASEWLDNGDSDRKLSLDPLFVKLKQHPRYQELLDRNQRQIERQIRIYDANHLKQTDTNTD